jgi:hypothetical protein
VLLLSSLFPQQVFPQLYLPVMEEGNKRVLRPYRKYLPTPAWFSFKWRMSKLNSFLINLIRERWQARQAGKPGRGDILDRILAAIEVSIERITSTLVLFTNLSIVYNNRIKTQARMARQ